MTELDYLSCVGTKSRPRRSALDRSLSSQRHKTLSIFDSGSPLTIKSPHKPETTLMKSWLLEIPAGPFLWISCVLARQAIPGSFAVPPSDAVDHVDP